MAIRFKCSSCGREVTAPDDAAGRKGRCPHCGQSNEIPSVPAGEQDDGTIPLAPIDEEEEHRRQEQLRALYEQELALLSETGGVADDVPLEHREEIDSEDLYHFVVNYCLDMANGKLDRAERHAEQLRRYGHWGAQAVDDFLSGSAREAALDYIPPRVLEGFLRQLLKRVRSAG